MQEMKSADQGKATKSLKKNLLRLPGTSHCSGCQKTISGNKVFCFSCTPTGLSNKAKRVAV
jgi:hypothetical protein